MDAFYKNNLLKLMKNLKQEGKTMVMVTHDTEIVNKMKKRVILLDTGRVLRDYQEGEYVHESN